MAIIIFAIVSLIVTLPLFLANGFVISQDIPFHFIWSEQFYKALAEGVLYPRWVDTPFGYGSPTFIFYAPLSFYVIGLIQFLTNSHIMSIKLAIYLSFFLSGLTMYLFAKRLNGQNAGLISGVLYQLIPYHVFDFFGRGVVPELFAFIWFPLILLFMREIFTDRRYSSMIYMSLAYAGLIMTHLVSSFMFTFVMVGYGIYLSLAEKKNGMLRMLCAMAIGLGLSAVYLLPVIFERGFVHIESIKMFNYRNCFLFLHKNLVERSFYPIVHAIALLEIAFLLFSFLAIKKKLIRIENTFFVLLLLVSLFLSTPLSIIIWRVMPEFSNLQFPWRWLTFSGLSVSIIAGYLITNFKGEVRKATIIICAPLLIITLFIMSQTSFFEPIEIDKWRMHPSLFSPFEYRPAWLHYPGRLLLPAEKAQVLEGTGSIDIIDWKSNQRIISTNGRTSLRLKLSTFYYPGWKARIDGTYGRIIVEKETGSMLIEVPEGGHKVEFIFGDTPVRYYGKVVSVISLIVLFLVYLHGMFAFPKKYLKQ